MVYSDGSDDGPLMFERCNSIPEKGNRVAVVMRARGGRVASVTSRLTLSICPFFNLPISSPLVTDRIFFLPADIIGVRKPQKWESRCDRWGKRSDQRWGERKSNFESLTSLPPNSARIRLAEVVWVTRSILVVARHVFKRNCQFWRSCLEAAASDQVCCRRRFLKCVTRPAASQGTVICHYHIVLNHNFITREVNILKSMISMKSQKISSLTILYMTILYMTTFCHRKCTKNVPRYLKCKPIRYIIGLLCLG